MLLIVISLLHTVAVELAVLKWEIMVLLRLGVLKIFTWRLILEPSYYLKMLGINVLNGEGIISCFGKLYESLVKVL